MPRSRRRIRGKSSPGGWNFRAATANCLVEMTPTAKSPVSFDVSALRLPRKGMPVAIDADERQRSALAEAHALLSVDSFRAELLVTPWKGDGVRVSGRVAGAIVQSCVVTLDPVPATVDEAVEALFIPESSPLARRMSDPSDEILVDPDGPDAPELFSGDTIDVGALAEEFFALGIDPYPRSGGAVGGVVHADGDDDPSPPSPFAALGKLKQRP
jgi:hypothetical protein